MGASSGAIRELVAFFGLDLDEKGFEKADKRLEQTKKGAENLTRVLEAVGVAFGMHEIAEFVHGQIELGAQLQHTSEMLGISTQDLQEFQYAAATVGISSEEGTMSLNHLNKAIGEAAMGNAEAAKTFAELHVQLKNADGSARPLSEILPDVADGFSKLDQSKKTAVAMTLFSRAGARMIPLLNKGGAGVRGLAKEFDKLGGGLDEDFIAKAEEAEHKTVMWNTTMTGLKSTLAGPLIDALMPVVDEASELAKWFRDLAKNTPVVTTVMYTLAAAGIAVAAAWALANIEILLVVAAIAVMALGVEDLVGFMQGKQSVIGDFLDELGGAGTGDSVRDFLKSLWQDLSDLYDEATNDLLPAIKELWDSFKSEDTKKEIHDVKDALAEAAEVTHDIATTFATITHYIAEATRLLAKVQNATKPGGAVDQLAAQAGVPGGGGTVREVESGVGGVAKFLGRHLFGAIPAALGDLSQEAGIVHMFAPSSSGNGGGVAGDLHSHAVVNITNNIDGGDPQQVSNATRAGVSNGLGDALNAAYPGVGGGGAP